MSGEPGRERPGPLRVLVFGGTGFLSGAVVAEALGRGWSVTAVHRGQRGTPDPRATSWIADRQADPPLPTGRFDAVLDVTAQRGAWVAHAARAVDAPRYVLVSSISVYEHLPPAGPTPDQPTAAPGDGAVDDWTTYAARKAACEQALADAPSAVSVRSGLLVGPGDPSERFTWWVRRLARGGDVLAPGTPDAPVQLLDVRDLATFVCDLATAEHTGPVDAVGPIRRLGDVLAALPGPPDTRLRWTPDAALLARGWQPWSSLPLWLPPESAGFVRFPDARCRAWGLRTRPLATTVADTAEWAASHPPERFPGPSAEDEAAALAAR